MLTIKEEVAKNLLYFRKKANLTQKELAEKIGVKHNSISSWEKGVNSIDIEVLFNICTALGITINDMYGIYGIQNCSQIESAPTTLSDEAIEVAEAYEIADDAIKTSVRKLLDVEDRQSGFADETNGQAV